MYPGPELKRDIVQSGTGGGLIAKNQVLQFEAWSGKHFRLAG